MLFSFSLFVISCTEIESPREEISLRALPDNNSESTLGCNYKPNGCVEHTETIDVLFAACSHIVTFTYFVCNDGIVIRDMSFVALPSGGIGCGVFDAQVQQLVDNGQYEEARDLLNFRHNFMSNVIENHVLNSSNIEKTDYPCNSTSQFTATFIAEDCIELCRSEGRIVELVCGGTCCIRRQQFCFNEDGALELIGGPTLESTDSPQCQVSNSGCAKVVDPCAGSDCKRLGGFSFDTGEM